MAKKLEYKDLLAAGVHFGHLKRKWNPKMAPYIFMEKNGIHLIDINKTLVALDEAAKAMKGVVRSNKKVLFVATKKQAREIVEQVAKRTGMPYVTERWLGGMLTNFSTIRKSIKKLNSLEKLMKSESYENLTKRERLMMERKKEKMEKVLGGILEMNRLPGALFIVDIHREHIALAEAKRLGIPVFAMVDTDSDPTSVDYPIPANDDAYKSIELIVNYIGDVIEEAQQERKQEKEAQKLQAEENKKRAMDEGADLENAPESHDEEE
ncbi:small subunit ribosomal protein S2 [Thermonema lapsum]|jgi:small subunit ribosomal protein S2|uniref:Small ribosomal subunit protein uS2 n=1 Tax=Thermonema lapsum TaxID=28195 RepID=A0A846MPN5_9BACT|nr:30S ribosomal protein S2 [Thermonema lapsum]NIK73523.1 small subunit ribosomal protein S2 [Thermonema lapsum]